MRPRIAELCAGYTGLGLAIAEVLGGELALVADNDPGASAILAHRFPSVPNYTDITTADWTAAGPVDILAAGFPCQPVSLAGKQLGEADERWIWPSVVRAVRDLRPGLVVLENVSALVVRGLAGVAADLAEIGYLGSWCCVRASDVGAPHRRERIFILAWPAEDADRAAGGQWRLAAPGQAAGWRPRADAGRSGGVRAIADATGQRHRDAGTPGERGIPAAAISGAPADTEGDGRNARRPEPARIIGGPDAAECGDRPPADAASSRRQACGELTQRVGEGRREGSAARTASPARIEWGAYELAIRRWEQVLRRSAPAPTEPGRTGQRLSPRFVEFLMGLPEGWVTDVPGLSRNAQLKALGNGVVPQQAAMALRLLLERSGLLPLVAADLAPAEGGEAA